MNNSSAEQKKTINNIQDLLKTLDDAKKMRLSYAVKNDLEITSIENGKIEMNITFKIDNNFILELRSFLEKITETNWQISHKRVEAVTSLANLANKERQAQIDDIKKDPLVKAILAEFYGASIETITRKAIEEAKTNFAEELTEDTFLEENLLD